MILEFNYDCKTITVKDQINLKEFIKEVKKSGIDLSEWSVKSEIIYSGYPIVAYPTYAIWPVYCGGDLSLTDVLDTKTNEPISGDITHINSVWNQQFSYTNN